MVLQAKTKHKYETNKSNPYFHNKTKPTYMIYWELALRPLNSISTILRINVYKQLMNGKRGEMRHMKQNVDCRWKSIKFWVGTET